MTLFCHPYFYKKFVTVIFTNVTVIFTIVTVLFTNVTVIFTNVTVFITKTDFDHLSPFLYTVFFKAVISVLKALEIIRIKQICELQKRTLIRCDQ